MLLHMIRKQIHIEKSQQARLRKRAAELGVSEAELIRRGIELYLERRELRRPVIDFGLWAEHKLFMKKLRRRRTGQKPWKWNREELHDRFAR